MKEYKLRKQEDIIKYEIAPLIEKHFPNYEKFYTRYIAKFIGHNGNWRTDMHPIFEEIGMADYAILKSLNYIRRSWMYVVTGDPNQTFKNVYFHFGLILDSVEHIGRDILRLKDELKIIDLKRAIKKEISKDTLGNWLDNQYDVEIDRYIKTGIPPSPPKGSKKFMELILQNELKRQYEKFSISLRKYRNLFAHNPSVGIFTAYINGTAIQLCPKKEKVKDYPLWTDIRLNWQSNPDDFTQPHILINNDFIDLLKLLNKIYEEYDKQMEKIFENQNVKNLLYGYVGR